jgi:DNA-binding Lrp family transcriptional regulator
MISKKDAEIISHLRNNARQKITTISRKTLVPVTTIYDKVRMQEKRFIKKHVTLLDFSKLGMHGCANIAINVEKESKDDLQRFLMANPNVNTLHKVNFSSDFLAEVVFKNIAEVENFVEKIESEYKINKIQIFSLVEELKKESFLTKPEHYEVLL